MKEKDFNRLVRPDIVEMEAYTPILPFEVLSAQLGRPPEAITKLDANENPYGPSPAVLEAIASGKWYHIYPDPESRELRAALSKNLQVPVQRIMAGMGADELIDLVLRALLAPGDKVLNCPPSFGMYPFSTAVNNGQVVNVPRQADFSLDIKAIERAVENNPAAKVLFLCSPNNPDGSVIGQAELRRLLQLPLLLVLDEAYIEFGMVDGEQSRTQWALEYENLAILRTFSKLAGLAGLRIGYGVFPIWIMPHLWKIKQPYNVNVAASLAALAALREPRWMQEKVALIVHERKRMVDELARFDFLEPYPSHSNFVLFRVLDRSAAELKQKLAAEGVLVRYFNKPGLGNCIRISTGRPEDSDRLLAAVEKIS